MTTNDFTFDIEKHHLLNGRILVKMPEVKEKTEGGIILPGQTIDSNIRSVVKGELVKYNEFAFKERCITNDGSVVYIDWKEKPEIGDIVFFTLYAGRWFEDKEGNRYRNMPSSDLIGFEENDELLKNLAKK